jgi:peptide/nickel transport system substrate-binding protein
MRRRLLATALAAPVVARSGRAASARVLKFIPRPDLATLDPMFATASVARCHGLLVFDTLYGMDNDYRANPRMVAGHVVSDDDRQSDLTPREGLRFHDGTPVLARDAVASIRRWWQRDAFGGAAGLSCHGNAGLASMIGARFGSSAADQPPPRASISATLATSRLCWTDSAVC